MVKEYYSTVEMAHARLLDHDGGAMIEARVRV